MSEVAPAAHILAPGMFSGGGDIIANSLSFVRRHLQMETAYVAEFEGNSAALRYYDAPGLEGLMTVGAEIDINTSFCWAVHTGDLPPLIPDTLDVAGTEGLISVHNLETRSFVGVPILRTDGTLYGMFCCCCGSPRPNLNDRDLDVVRAFAALSADQLNAQLNAQEVTRARRATIETVLDQRDFRIALQPIQRLPSQKVAGYEALCRFSAEPYRPPNVWFDDAAQVGLQQELELTVMEVALNLLDELEAGCYLAINLSPRTLASGQVSPLIDRFGGERVVVEITEHSEIEDLDALRLEIDRIRDLGGKIAIDDAGAGYSGLQQILRLRPNLIKLDMSLTKDVDKDVARRSLASALVQFARDTGASVVAEGIETEEELLTLAGLGVDMGQGYHLGRPKLAEDMFMKTKPSASKIA